MEPTLKRKLTVKLTFTDAAPAPQRPVSPAKPRAKVTASAPARKPAHSVSSVPHTSSSLAATARSRPGTSDGPSSRPASPTKLRSTLSPPSHHARVQTTSNSRPTLARSTPATPHLRHRSQTSSSTDLRNPGPRTRPTAVPLHHTVSHSALQASTPSHSPPSSLLDTPAHSDNEGRHSPSIRVKSKVTGLARSTGPAVSPTTTATQAPFSSTTARLTHRPRVPSISSAVSAPPSTTPAPPSNPSPGPQIFYPITTATPAANPHRYSASRSPPLPAAQNHHYQPFSPPNGTPAAQPRWSGLARVDPAAIPLPAGSPPTSALSFSSRSSVSRSSAPIARHSADPSGDPDRLTLRDLSPSDDAFSRTSSSQDTDTEFGSTSEHKVRAAAKSNRKIADLEITNRSLLAINASLESQKHKQAKEIRDLRRKLRESRLILPPRAYQAVRSSLTYDDTAEDDDDDDADDDDDDGDDEYGDEGDPNRRHPTGTNKVDKSDEIYKRLNGMVEGLIESGRRALEAKPEELLPGGGTKVLNPDEVRTWRDSSGGRSDRTLQPGDKDNYNDDNDNDRSFVVEDIDISFTSSTQSLSDSEDDDDGFSLTNLSSHSRSTLTHPPILITDLD